MILTKDNLIKRIQEQDAETDRLKHELEGIKRDRTFHEPGGVYRIPEDSNPAVIICFAAFWLFGVIVGAVANHYWAL